METEIETITQNPDAPTPLSPPQRYATLSAIILPFIGLLVAVYGFWGWGVSWVELAILVVMYVATGLGITIGYHRLFTHRAFETNRPIQVLFAVLGSMAVEGSLLRWVATHRKHHQHSDKADDPHSPHHFGRGFFAVIAGWWHAHAGWILKPDPPNLLRYVRDLESDRVIRRVSELFPLWVILGFLVPTVAGGLITATWTGALLGFLWGGLVRIFLVHHVTWSINSVCHLWGTRPFQSRDFSRNNAICGILSFGEGWHNNHHAFPTSARHGLRWWQLDTSYLVICGLKWVGLAWQVRVPSTETIQLRKIADASKADAA